MTYEIIGTGSSGNALVLNGCILIDIGLPMSRIRPYVKDLKLVLLTHIHSDHFNPATVRTLATERPSLRWCCCWWMVEPLLQAGVDKRRIDVVPPDNQLFYPDLCSVSPVMLVHDVPNCGWKINIFGEKAIYATDTGTLAGVEAPGYDMYLVEANYKTEELMERWAAKEAAGEYAYESRVIKTHLSEEQTMDWLGSQMGPNSQYVFLHQHREE